MAYSHRLVMEAVKAEFVAGELVARIGKKHISIGRMTQDGGFVYTPKGLELANRIEQEAINGVVEEDAHANSKAAVKVSPKPVKKVAVKAGKKAREAQPTVEVHALTDAEIEALLNAETLD